LFSAASTTAAAAAAATAGWRLLYAGRYLAGDAAPPTAPSVLRVCTGGLLGGKGGFGAMLRSMAKQAGKKPTRDFGACRDLQGRRLRHVNDEIALRKWREKEREKGETDFPEEDERTPSGIAGWHLGVPSWAEGIKMGDKDERPSYMKQRRKTSICKDWTAARAPGRRGPPDGAPSWWGCPRRRDCDFAHGPDELRGHGLQAHKKRSREESAAARHAAAEAYAGAADLEEVEARMADAVREGLEAERAAKRQRRASAKARSAKAAARAAGNGGENSESEEEERGRTGCSWIEQLSGDVAMAEDGVLEAHDNFDTVRVRGVAADAGRLYYEVRLVTAGQPVQIGWADREFTVGGGGSSGGDEEAGELDGVGDNVHSWAYDGSRRLCWSGGSREYGRRWKSGDVIGCMLDADAGVVAFRCNGEDMGPAFTGVRPATVA
ncbi:unnamed protein product, partial [Phaeothamnion confervicola]